MERRRLAVLCSHLRPIGSGFSESSSIRFSPGSTSTSIHETQSRDGGGRENNQENDCVFCKIIRGEAPAFKLYEDDTCLCILDTNPLSHGHSLVIPKFHFSSLDATPSSVVAAMCSKVPFISNAIMKATSCDSFNLLVNNGVAAGQVIFHTHIHIIPRKARDLLWASESLQRHPLKLDDEASQLADRVREQLESSKNLKESKCPGSCLRERK